MRTATLTSPHVHSGSPSRQGKGLRVVIVEEELPYPATSGKRIRSLNLTLRLAKRHRLTYLCHRNQDPAEAEAARAFFSDHGIETIVVDRPVPRKSGLGFYARLAWNLLSPLPYSVATHTSRPLRRAILDLAAREPVDLWHCEWTPYAESLRCLPPGARRLVMAHNVESLIWQRYHETESNWLKRWYIGHQWRKFERFERRVVGEVDCTVAVSPDDAELFRSRFGAERVAVVDNGVDTAYFQPSDVPRNPNRILFLGSLDWRPNLDAVEQMLTHLVGAVRLRWSAAEFCIVGRNPPSWLRERVASTPGAELHADVPDVRPFLHSSSVLAVPLRIGGGSRLKILEALATGLPVVSTRIGAEGLSLEPGRHLTISEPVAEMADALAGALRDPAAAQRMADEGRRRVLERYNWDVLADRLEEVWLDCCNTPPHY